MHTRGMVDFKELKGFATLKYTKFATILQRDRYVVKDICKDVAVAPHDSRSELEILKKLSSQRHSHVVQLLDYQSDEESLKLLFLFYELDLDEYMRSCYKPPKMKSNPYYDFAADGEPCQSQQKARRNQFDVGKYAHNFFLQLSQALQFIHSQGVIHRDLKPQNVLLDSFKHPPQLVLTDFGISYDTHDPRQAQREPADAKITDVSTSIYKAPELLFGVKNYTYAVDIWALLVLISQWFQEEAVVWPPSHLPAMVDDGSGQLEDGESGSDIRLILSIFSNFGIPPVQGWVEVDRYGSSEAFRGMFGSNGDGNYLPDKRREDQLQTIHKLMPRLYEIGDDGSKKQAVENCILGMIPFESGKRWDSKRIVDELSR